jgi:hypothetical protein
MSTPVNYYDLPPRSQHFNTLYHGTRIENAASICKEGIKRGTPDRVGYISKNDPLGADRVKDCIGYVNMSKNQKSAIFFACGWLPPDQLRNDHGQAIFEIDPKKLEKSLMYFTDMFGDRYAEVTYLKDVQPEAIKRVYLRKFTWKDGDMGVEENYRTCDEISDGKF